MEMPMKETKTCFLCGNRGAVMYDYCICESCKSKLGLFTDGTIRRHISEYTPSKKYRTYAEEINDRLHILEQDYIKKRIKLLHVLERLKCID